MKTITRDELHEKISRGDDFVLVDVLSSESFQEMHIPGAINLPAVELRERASEVLPDKNREIICYCASFQCPASTTACKILEEIGYTKVVDYKGGLKDWQEAGYLVESAQPAAAR